MKKNIEYENFNKMPLYKQLVQFILSNSFENKIAIKSGESCISYGQLINYSNRLGTYLTTLPEKSTNQFIIAVLLPKSHFQIISVWGILAANGVYLPIDIDQPPERIKDILFDSHPLVIIMDSTTNHLVSDIENINFIDINEFLLSIETQPISNFADLPGFNSKNNDLAYIIYTSGTTGKPKGVLIENKGVLNAIHFTRNYLFRNIRHLTILGISALHHDMSVFDTLGTFLYGGVLILPEEKERKDPDIWSKLIRKHQVNIWISVPTMAEMLITWCEYRELKLESLSIVMLGGDVISLTLPDQIKDITSDKVKIFSIGGPTETTMWNIFNEIKKEDEKEWKSIPYGIPIPNCFYKILDESLQDVSYGEIGEMYCGGISLARGYLNDEKLTESKFIFHPIMRERLYRTGDFGFYHFDQRIEFVGRHDGQLKVRGNRIDESEVRSKLEKWPEIKRAIVYVYNGELVAVLVLRSNFEKMKHDKLYKRIKTELPPVMIPSLWLQMYNLPLTRNSKVDMKALRDMTKEYLNN